MIGREGAVSSVMWDGPAFKAGLIPGDALTAVNGEAYSPEIVHAALKEGRGKGGGLDLLVKSGDRFRTVHVAYDGGLRYPHLEREGAGPAGLDAIAAPRK